MRATATRLLFTLIIAAAPLFAGIAAAETVGTAPLSAAPEVIETGEATWYGPRHEGHRTSSGEMFDSHKFTAAHASLPLGSYVRVTVQSTGRSLVVKVNDREPPHGVRCIDLSKGAAARLGIVSRGSADVTLETATREDAVEVAEAPDDLAPRHVTSRVINRRHGLPHRHHAHR
jgi:rare lipoprotein A (peptidoglycan hydrolase)